MELMETKVALDTLWVMFAACLVFFMNAGFAMLEAGLCQAKNAVNILAKNFIVFAVSSMAFWAVGFAFMFGNGGSFVGTSGFFLGGADNSPAMGDAYSGVFSALNWTGVPLAAKFFFQLVFAGTAATIVSGAVAERVKFLGFIVFSFLLVCFIYPVGGHWAWGGGFLGSAGFTDFAGSTVVHSIGGWAALTGVMILGPRAGKYTSAGRVSPIPGHNMSLATLGAPVLWLGWFGFNPGSTMAADPSVIASVTLSTNMAAAAGCLSATAVAWLMLGKPDLSMILNGTLAGLVNGVWGTFAVGLFATEGGLFHGGGLDLTLAQVKGIVAVGLFTAVATALAWYALKLTIGIRVSAEEEREGLDTGEHGMEAYPGFVNATSIFGPKGA